MMVAAVSRPRHGEGDVWRASGGEGGDVSAQARGCRRPAGCCDRCCSSLEVATEMGEDKVGAQNRNRSKGRAVD